MSARPACSCAIRRSKGGRPCAGVIIHTASTNAILGDENAVHYNASKGGVVSLTKSMALDLAPYNIRVNCVCPGMVLPRISEAMGDDPELLATVRQAYSEPYVYAREDR